MRKAFKFTACIVLTFTLAASIFAAQASSGSAPNILFIIVDEMRWDAMSCAGHPIARTPHLDRLAHEGTRFEATYTCAPVCVPSRYCFFTSRYAHVHGSLGNNMSTHAGELFLPAILKHQGYQTAISGKLHFLPPGKDYGFEYFWSYGYEGPGKLPNWPDFLEQKYGKPGRQLLDQPYPGDPLGRDIGRLSYPKEDMQSFWITDRALDFLHQRDQQKPFFLYVSYLDPHSPSHLAEPYWSMFDPKKMPRPDIPEAIKQERAKALKAGVSGAGSTTRVLIDNEEMAKYLAATYFAKIALVDDNIARLLQEVERLRLLDNTIIVFTSDHGNMLGDHGRWFKGVMYEGSSRIPLIIKAPTAGSLAAAFNRGKVVPEIVENIDVMPTLMEMIGTPLPAQPGFQGKSLVNLVAGKDPHWKNTAYAELGPKMIRTPQYKLIRNGEAFELYDLIRDPKEDHNLAGDPAHARALEELKTKLEAWLHDSPPRPVMAGVEKSEASDTVPGKARGKDGKKKRPS